jgi:hypothetical protein
MFSLPTETLVGMTTVDIEVETDEENDSDQEGDEREEDELLEQTRFLEVDGELVLLLRQFVSITFEKGATNVFHVAIA